MQYFKLRITEEKRVWKNYFIFAERFLFKGNEILFSDAYTQKTILDNLKIQALNNQGDIVKNQDYFMKEKESFFCKIRNVFLIREDIFKEESFKYSNGVEFFTVKVDGEFEYSYKLLSFTNVVDCVNWEKSMRTQFDFSSKLILAEQKIPKDIDGFFLSGWHRYGQYNSIINEKLKNSLLELEKASEFLLFDKVDYK